MQPEHVEILEFLRGVAPLAQLPEDELTAIASQVEIRYFKAGSRILEWNQQVQHWHVVRSGAVEVHRRDGELYNRLGEGGYFAEFALLRGRRVRFPVVALEDTLVYLIPDGVFDRLFEKYESFAENVEVEDRTRLRQAVAQREAGNDFLTSRVEKLIAHEPLSMGTGVSVQQAAQCMSAAAASSLLLLEDDGSVAGLITDRDLRDRLVAPGLAFETPVREIMTTDLIMVQHNQLVFEAMLLMLRHNVHHLPVLRRGRPVGVIALSDVARYESQNSLFVVSSIFSAQSVDELARLRAPTRACFIRMVNEDANSRMIGGAMALIGRSFKQRLLELGEQELGPPPVPYCLLALGSMAREEQLIVTDQDNAMILDDCFKPGHDKYFAALAQFVSDGLDRCGYSYCTGGIMATNPQWRQPLRVWREYFTEWIERPTAKFLLNSSIFFDLAPVGGDADMARELQQLILNKAKGNRKFLACLARNALLRKPPLGFFKTFVLETDGEHSNIINMKRRGTAPLADVVRTHALAAGSASLNTYERLNDVIESGLLPDGRGEDLRDALELIAMVRIRHQALALEAGKEPNNNVAPENLSEFERKNLKDAFQVLVNAQNFLRYRYNANNAV